MLQWLYAQSNLGFRLVLLALAIGLFPTFPVVAQSAIVEQAGVLRSEQLQGSLSTQTAKHFLGLEPLVRDGEIELTLTYEPAQRAGVPAPIELLILSEHGLRRHLAGAPLAEVALLQATSTTMTATGPQQRLSFQAVGRGTYTVVVINRQATALQYWLSATGATLVDEAGQTSYAMLGAGPEATTQTVGLSNKSAETLMSELPARGTRYLALRPTIRNAQVTVMLTPTDGANAQLSFYILNEDALRRVLQGEAPQQQNLAAGIAPTYRASFQASGYGPYTIVIVNEGKQSAAYSLIIDGGKLIDSAE